MIYDFSFKSIKRDNEAFFLSIIENIAQSLQIAHFHYVESSQNAKIFHILIADIQEIYNHSKAPFLEALKAQNSEVILSFANALSSALPLSLYFQFLSLEKLDSSVLNAPSQHKDFKSQLEAYFKTPLSTSLVSTSLEAKSFYYSASDMKALLDTKDIALLNPASKSHKPLHLPSNNYFLDIINALKSGQKVAFDTQRGIKLLSLKPSDSVESTLVCDIASLKSYFRIKEAQIEKLATFEKPLTHLVPKEVFEAEFALDSRGYALISLPYDMPLALLCALALEQEISYIFLESSQDFNVDSSADSNMASSQAPFMFNHTSDMPITINIASNGAFATMAKDINASFDSLLAPLYSTDSSLVFYLSSARESKFLIHSNNSAKVLLDIAFECNARLIVEDIIKHYESGDELLKNFSLKAPDLSARIFALNAVSKTSQNLLDMLDSIAFILGLEYRKKCDKNALFYYASRFVRDKGPRIDYKLTRKDNALSLDYNRIVRSILSFKCAGMEDEILAFGVLDSLSEFVANLARDAMVNLNIKRVICFGDMMGNNIFLERLTSYLPKDLALILPLESALDY